jgi:hypothetical protein
MKRLFTVDGQHFESKSAAKAARGPKNEAGNYKHTVSKGPDHIGNHGHSVPASRHRAPQGYFQPKEA